MLDLLRRIRALEDFDQAHHFQVGPQGSEDEEELGGVGGLVVAEAGVGRHHAPLPPATSALFNSL